MKRLHILLTSFIVILLASCEREDKVMLNEGVFHYSINASIDGFDYCDDTKASGEYVVKLKWKAGDQVSVVNTTTNKVLGGTLSAQADGYTTTFDGDLNGSIADGDELLFILPALGNSDPVEFDDYIIDFSNQVGTSSSSVLFSAYAKEPSAGSSVSGKTYSFSFLSSYLLLSLSNLPGSTTMYDVTLTGLPSKLALSYRNGSLSTQSIEDGNIVLTPAEGYKTSTSGYRNFYLTLPASAASSTRKVIVHTSAGTYESSVVSAAFNQAYNYRIVSSAFTRTDSTPLSFSSVYPSIIDGFDTGRSWSAGDAISIVNLTTGELLKNTLTASQSSTTAQFTGSVTGLEGVNAGDELLFLFPAVGNDDYRDFKSSPILYDINRAQDGTSADAPVILAAEAVYGADGVTLTKDFSHQMSLAMISTNWSQDGSGLIGTGASSDAGTGAGHESLGFEYGSWGEDLNFDIDRVELKYLPSKLLISASGDHGYKLSTVTDDEMIMVTPGNAKVVSNVAPDIFVAIPAAGAEGAEASMGVTFYDAAGNAHPTAPVQWSLASGKFFRFALGSE